MSLGSAFPYPKGVNNTGTSLSFKFKNGVFKEVNKAELQAIVYTGSMHIKNLFGWESTKTAEIDSTTTIADLKLIDLKHELQNGN